jgi:hypothetical protein
MFSDGADAVPSAGPALTQGCGTSLLLPVVDIDGFQLQAAAARGM